MTARGQMCRPIDALLTDGQCGTAKVTRPRTRACAVHAQSSGCRELGMQADQLKVRCHRPSGHYTMGPQPDLARHRGSRRLVANGVKCMSNYSELSTYHEYGNIFSDVMYSFRVTRAISQNFETTTGNKFAAREKCRLLDVQKLQP